ncbi:multicopper oxidase family protein [Falsiroseomonas sp.]|uniref:multicopper oxidase family protein n=1 Tax=Falsiroseomonas sp. TaxID=2870721 RepID=UPI003568FFD8
MARQSKRSAEPDHANSGDEDAALLTHMRLNTPAPRTAEPEAGRAAMPAATPYVAEAAMSHAAALLLVAEAAMQDQAYENEQEHEHGEMEPMPVVLRDVSMGDLFQAALPLPPVIDATGGGTLVLQIRQTEQWLGLTDGDGNRLMTTVWGYGQGNNPTFPGPTIIAQEGVPLRVHWQNKLPMGDHLLPVDTSIHHAMGMLPGSIPTVTHLHGGHTSSESDGIPEAWFTQNHRETGPDYGGRITTYDNDQDAAVIWYHDHALGITRQNVYAGLAGFYVLEDETEQALVENGYLPGRAFQLGMAVQDRAFTADGQLYLPGASPDDPLPGTEETVADLLPEDYVERGGTFPTAVPEFFGDHILVNGMIWPYLEVDPGAWRFQLLNGSDSRFYVLEFDNPHVAAKLVGVDGGLLRHAVTIMDGDGTQEAGERITMAPGDRVDIVVDFSDAALLGQSVRLLNHGPAFEPFKGFAADGSLAGGAEAATPDIPVGNIMQFRIGAEDLLANTAGVMADAANATQMVSDAEWAAKDLLGATPDRVRQLGLFEGEDEFGRILPSLGLVEDVPDVNGDIQGFGALGYHAPVTEIIELGDVEVWRIHNLSEDAHPLHLHLVQFQVAGRQTFTFADADEDGVPDDVSGDGMVDEQDLTYAPGRALLPEETGFQDTVWIAPGEVMEVIARFDRPGEYVWHCHILSHEDHDMMRPFLVVDAVI